MFISVKLAKNLIYSKQIQIDKSFLSFLLVITYLEATQHFNI